MAIEIENKKIWIKLLKSIIFNILYNHIIGIKNAQP